MMRMMRKKCKTHHHLKLRHWGFIMMFCFHCHGVHWLQFESYKWVCSNNTAGCGLRRKKKKRTKAARGRKHGKKAKGKDKKKKKHKSTTALFSNHCQASKIPLSNVLLPGSSSDSTGSAGLSDTELNKLELSESFASICVEH